MPPTIRLVASRKWQELVYAYRCTFDRSASGGRRARDERRVKPVCGSFELCNCSAGSAILPPSPPSSATTVHGTFSFPIIAAAAVRGEKEECVSINRSAHYTYYYVYIEGREKKKEKKRVQAV